MDSKLECLQAMFCSGSFTITRLKTAGFMRYWRYHFSSGSQFLETDSGLLWHFVSLSIEKHFVFEFQKI